MLWVMNPEKRSQNIENVLVSAKTNNIIHYVLSEKKLYFKLIIIELGNYISTLFGFVT